MKKDKGLKNRMKKYLVENQLDWPIIFSDQEKDILAGEHIKKELDNGLRLLIVAGGDGTLNHIVNLLVGTKCTLAVLPLGTGNDFSRNIYSGAQAAFAPEQLLDLIRKGRDIALDLGWINGRYFINVAGIGFDADVIRNDAKLRKIGFPKAFSYLAACFYSGLSLKNFHMVLKAKEKNIAEEVLMLVVVNGKYFGGGLMIAPEAVIDDGKLALCVVRNMSRIQFYRLFPKFLKGEHVQDKLKDWISYEPMEQIVVDTVHKMPYEMDGELFYDQHFNIKIQRAAISLRVPIAE